MTIANFHKKVSDRLRLNIGVKKSISKFRCMSIIMLFSEEILIIFSFFWAQPSSGFIRCFRGVRIEPGVVRNTLVKAFEHGLSLSDLSFSCLTTLF